MSDDKTQNLAHAYYKACLERDAARAEVERLKDALIRLAGCDQAQVDYIAENDYVPDLNDGQEAP